LSLGRGIDPSTRIEEGITVLDNEDGLEVKKNVTPRSVVLAEYNRMIDKIDASALMQDELRRTDPNLALALSFLSVVTGGTKRKRIIKESEDVPATKAETKAESLLRDELKKINPSMTSVAAFRKAAYGDESLKTTNLGARQMIVQEVTTNTKESLTSTLPLTTETELVMEEDVHKLKAQPGECNKAELVTSDDAEMSTGGSDEEETGSDGFSGL